MLIYLSPTRHLHSESPDPAEYLVPPTLRDLTLGKFDHAQSSSLGNLIRWITMQPVSSPPSNTEERSSRPGARSGASNLPAGRPQRYERRSQTGCTVSVILPTYNEVENVTILVDSLHEVLVDLDYEIIIVDDNSPDRTWAVAGELATNHPRVRSIRRIGDRGLSSAVISGMHLAQGRVLAVMDADLQHDESALVDLINPILDGEADIVVGSREVDGGSYGDFSQWRRAVSWTGKQLAERLLRTGVSDPMSGYFAVSSDRFHDVEDRVNPRGFKILLEFLARGDQPRVCEIGYEFRDRQRGATKMSRSVAGSYLLALLDLVFGRVVSATFTAYALVGILGVVVRVLAGSLFSALLPATGLALPIGFSLDAGLLAFEVSALTNYVLNNRFTFARNARVGRRFFTGLIPFHVIAGYGLVLQVGITTMIGTAQPSVLGQQNVGAFILNQALWIQLVGIAAATTGNFIGNRSITWRPRTYRTA